jgi:hypothetical protein
MTDPRIETALETLLRQYAEILFGFLEREHGFRLTPQEQNMARKFTAACVPVPFVLTEINPPEDQIA